MRRDSRVGYFAFRTWIVMTSSAGTETPPYGLTRGWESAIASRTCLQAGFIRSDDALLLAMQLYERFTPGPALDEAVTSDGEVREHYRPLVQKLLATEPPRQPLIGRFDKDLRDAAKCHVKSLLLHVQAVVNYGCDFVEMT